MVPALPVLVALFTAVRAGRRWPAGAAVGVIVIGGLIGELTCAQLSPDVLQRWYLLIGWLLAAAVTGELARAHHAYLDQVEQRAADAERTREETAQRRADEERVRIARELHDTLTHHISIIKVHAGVAVHLARKRDQPVPDALVAIERASGDAMRELRATLELLRGDSNRPGGLDRIAAPGRRSSRRRSSGAGDCGRGAACDCRTWWTGPHIGSSRRHSPTPPGMPVRQRRQSFSSTSMTG